MCDVGLTSSHTTFPAQPTPCGAPWFAPKNESHRTQQFLVAQPWQRHWRHCKQLSPLYPNPQPTVFQPRVPSSTYNRLQNSWHTLQNFGIFLMNAAPQLKKIPFAKFPPAPPINVDHSFRHYGHFVSGQHCAGGRGGEVLPRFGMLENSPKTVKCVITFETDCPKVSPTKIRV